MVILIFGVGNFFGLLLGGSGGTYLYGLDRRYPALLAGCMAIAGCFPFWILLNSVDKDSNILFLVVVCLLAGILTGGTGPIVKATLQNVTLPHVRGQAFALFNTFDDFGRGKEFGGSLPTSATTCFTNALHVLRQKASGQPSLLDA